MWKILRPAHMISSMRDRLRQAQENRGMNTVLIVLSAGFVALCFWALSYGLPFHLVGDEESLIGGTLKMLELKTFLPVLNADAFQLLYYPVLIPYAIIVLILPYVAALLVFVPEVTSLTDAANYSLIHLQDVWFLARIPSVAAGAALVFVVYKLSLVVFKDKPYVAFFASLFILTSFFHFQLSIFVRHWIFTTLFFYSALFFFYRNYFHEKKDAILAGVMVGLAFGVSNMGFVVAGILVLLYGFYKRSQRWLGFTQKNIWYFGIVAALLGIFFLGTNLNATFDFIDAGHDVSQVSTTIQPAYLLSEFFTTFNYFLNKEIVLFILAIVGGVFLFVQKKKKHLFVFLSIILIHNLALYILFHNAARYHIIEIPLFALMAGYVVAWAYEFLLQKNLKWVGVLLGILLFAFPALSIGRTAYLLAQPTTQQLAAQWIDENVDERSFILESRTLDFLPTNDYLEIQESYGRAPARHRALAGVAVERFGGQRHAYTNIHLWDNEKKNTQTVKELLELSSPAYFVHTYDVSRETSIPHTAFLRSQSTVLQTFSPSKADIRESIDAFGDFGFANQLLFRIDRFGQLVDIFSFSKYD